MVPLARARGVACGLLPPVTAAPVPEISWWGHATATIADSGVRILTDPVLTPMVGHLRRRRGPAPTAAASEADLVLISHLHGDHLHVRSLRQISHRVPIVMPRGAGQAIRALRFLRHLGRDRDQRGGGAAGRTRAHQGSAGASRPPPSRPGPARLGARRSATSSRVPVEPTSPATRICTRRWRRTSGACDVALLPVGGWGPGLGPGHLNSSTAAEAVALLGVTDVVPIHFGTLWPIGMDRVRPEEFLQPGARTSSGRGPGRPRRATVHLLTYRARPYGSRHERHRRDDDRGRPQASTDSTVQTVTYWTLFGGVALGAIVPVIPTGALVSAAAASLPCTRRTRSPRCW